MTRLRVRLPKEAPRPFDSKPAPAYPAKPGPKPGSLPTVKQCIARIEEAGWVYQHRCVLGTYVFRNDSSSPSEATFTLRELREAYRYGW